MLRPQDVEKFLENCLPDILFNYKINEGIYFAVLL